MERSGRGLTGAAICRKTRLGENRLRKLSQGVYGKRVTGGVLYGIYEVVSCVSFP